MEISSRTRDLIFNPSIRREDSVFILVQSRLWLILVIRDIRGLEKIEMKLEIVRKDHKIWLTFDNCGTSTLILLVTHTVSHSIISG